MEIQCHRCPLLLSHNPRAVRRVARRVLPCAVGVYALFVAENIAVKKLFRLSFKKADWILLFAHPVLVALFALPVHLAVILASYGTEKLNWLWDIDTYFYQGTVIAGYLITEGVIFVRGMKGEPQ